MSNLKLTDLEARRLIEMSKRSLIAAMSFPTRGNSKEFDVVGDNKNDIFTINIYRGKLPRFKYNIGARIKKNGIMLLELHVNPTSVHFNPDGEKIISSHWHIYTEEFGRAYAFPADDIKDEDFVENTINFLTRFNVIEKPNIIHQLELF